jgi:hypothetical protein
VRERERERERKKREIDEREKKERETENREMRERDSGLAWLARWLVGGGEGSQEPARRKSQVFD